MYGEHGWNSSVPGNEKLHRDYEILNEYVSKNRLFQEMIQELDLVLSLAQLAEFE